MTRPPAAAAVPVRRRGPRARYRASYGTGSVQVWVRAATAPPS